MGRRSERDLLDRLIEAVRAGESRALVVRGEPGVGKTALLEYLAERASGRPRRACRGVQSEMELAFAALHQLCSPMLDRPRASPGRTRRRCGPAFGMSAGSAPDRFLLGLAVLSLFSDVAEERPLVCVVDDEQWLDRASAQVLAFVARRLEAESVGLVFAARKPSHDLAGLPELVVEGLREDDARTLLDGAFTGPLDARVRDQIITETHGNPLAFARAGAGVDAGGTGGRLRAPRAPFRSPGGSKRASGSGLDALPLETRRLLRLAAADPVGEPLLVWPSSERLGMPARGGHGGRRGGLLEFDARVDFVIRWCARRPTARLRPRNGAPFTPRWQM